MKIKDQRDEFVRALGQACYGAGIGDADRQLAQYLSAIEDLDADAQAACKLDLARKGLQLEQELVPRLQELATKILDGAGARAIRDACTPIERTELGAGGVQRPTTDTQGRRMQPLKSGYTMPERFRSMLGSVVGVVAGR
jgi:hypothetical protein